MALPQIKAFDASKVTGNYLAARGARRQNERLDKQDERQNVLAGQRDTAFGNALTDRSRRIEGEDKAADTKERLARIQSDETWKKRGTELMLQINPDEPDDAIFNESVSGVADQLGARMNDLGYEPAEIKSTVQSIFRNGGFSRDMIRNLQEKEGLRKPAAKLTGAAANLEVILGRKPTLKEIREHKAKGATGQAPADVKMIEYMVSNKIAKSKKQAYKMVQMSKSDPVKVVSNLVLKAEEAQTAADIRPGEEGYRDRATLISDAKKMVTGIRQEFIGDDGEPPAQPPASGTDPLAWAKGPGGGGGIPTPQTEEEFNALPSGTIYIDPDDGKQYRK